MPEQTAATGAASLAGLSGNELARARRAMLSQGGKKGLGMLAKPGRTRPQAAVATPVPAAEPAPEPRAEPMMAAAAGTEGGESPIAEEIIETLCTVVEENPAALGDDASSVRQLCRDRRRLLSTQGKSALPAKNGSAASGARSSARQAGEVSGRDKARQRRIEMSQKGRGDAPALRPSGRVRPQAGEAPAKVEVGTTLSGQAVTGTQVERSVRVTGSESGSCRAITGTEYIGSEQFETFCASRPAPAAAKVGMSATSRGQWVSGTEVGRSSRVTGGEAGTCKPVTGTEYLGSEDFASFCEGKRLQSRPEKAGVGATERKGIAITGSDEARPRPVTGNEPGAKRAITGSQYADAGVSRLTINGPSKVALTHTLAGRPVSGTEVGRSVKVTGDEAGACRSISGTEYLSNEQFQSICHTRPEPAAAKVGEDASRGGQRITGNLVDRSEKVTGNEPGSCQRVTGSQYAQGALCGGAPEKAALMHTLAGRALTGTAMARGPKLTGDEHGGCQPVTGTEYYGQEQYSEYCPGTPQPAAAKVGISQTGHGLAVSGAMLGRSGRVTGAEPGSGLAISGTPYVGQEQIEQGCGCGCDEAGQAAAEARTVMAPRYRAPGARAMAMAMRPAAARPESFSISSPAAEARGRITGSGYGSAGRITGPVNMAAGLVSGTPEFRYRDEMGRIEVMPPASRQEAAPAQRITGEGREDGIRITGDDWARSGRVTGTEGHWAQGRNLTLRGEVRSMSAGAWANKDRERPEVPLARVTGSSGNAGKGALITVSGGARG
ncbi:carboxysome shell peptide [Sulfuritortus calidifontis]|uniref:Carboxysome shell peptide n=1 Tax=Sulfuritortus calidifontis TaxID=1914471 RepID=A0A4R3JXZ1_9PROT|nr:CsoS2 family carboxysome shell protein [Sulfuritortus calidifontis]TCS72402.1 carboxysome shell peptide [Sulfuritortus calidifontis]